MFTDRQLTCSDNQAITATAVSTDSVQLDGLYMGRQGDDMRAYVQVDTTFTAAGAATLTVEIIEADNAALTTNVNSLWSSGALALAALAVNPKANLVDVPFPKNTKKFVGFRYTVATGPMTAGAVTAGFVTGTATPLNDRATFYTGRGA